jgi:hypothetical protein
MEFDPELKLLFLELESGRRLSIRMACSCNNCLNYIGEVSQLYICDDCGKTFCKRCINKDCCCGKLVRADSL